MFKPDMFSMEKAYVGAPEQFLLFPEELIRGRFGNIIRAKGLIPAGAFALRFDVADGRYSVRLERSRVCGRDGSKCRSGLHRAWNRKAGDTPCDTAKKHSAARKDTLYRCGKSEIRDFPTVTFAG